MTIVIDHSNKKEEYMNTLNQLLTRIEENEGLLNVKNAINEGFSKDLIELCIEEYKLFKLTIGVYLTPEAAQDEMFLIRVFSNNAVFSHETALYLHHLADSNVLKWVVTAPAGYGAIPLKTRGVKVHFMKQSHYKLGLIQTKSNYGRTIATFNAERTICDILRDNNEISPAILEEALTRYAARENKDYDLLFYYAKQFRIEGLLNKYRHFLGF